MTAKEILGTLMKYLRDKKLFPLNLEYMVCMCTDTCNTMFGSKGGVLPMAKLEPELLFIFLSKCILHLINLAVVEACVLDEKAKHMSSIRNTVLLIDKIIRLD